MTKDRLDAQQTFASVAPWLFVFLWSTGFIVARHATNDADPMAFLSARLIVASLILAAIAHLSNAPRPTAHESRWSIVVGLEFMRHTSVVSSLRLTLVAFRCWRSCCRPPPGDHRGGWRGNARRASEFPSGAVSFLASPVLFSSSLTALPMTRSTFRFAP